MQFSWIESAAVVRLKGSQFVLQAAAKCSLRCLDQPADHLPIGTVSVGSPMV